MKIEYKTKPLELLNIKHCCHNMKSLLGRILDPISIYPYGFLEHGEDIGYNVSTEFHYMGKDGKMWNTVPYIINYCPFCGQRIEVKELLK